jgi:PAS domain S-box-containing protein
MSLDSTRSSLELLYHVSRELANEIELRPLLKKTLTLAVYHIGAERASIVILNEKNKPIDAAIMYGDKIYTHTIQQLKETIEKGIAGWVIRHHKPVMIDDTREDLRWVRRPDDDTKKSGAKSALCVPLMAHRKLVGVLTLVHPQVSFFNNDHMELLQSIADIAGLAALNARLYENSKQRSRVMSALIDNAVALNSSLQLDEVLQILMEQTAQALDVEVAALGFITNDGKEIEFHSAWGESSQFVEHVRIAVGKGVAGMVAATGKSVVAGSAELSEIDQYPGYSIHSIAAAPVQANNQIIGVLLAMNPKLDEFDPDTLTILNAICNVAGTAIRNAQTYEQLHLSQQRYAELFEDHIDPILITDFSGTILEANQQACTILQLTKERILQTNINQVHSLIATKLGPDFSQVMEHGTITYESEMLVSNNQRVPVQVIARRVNFSGAVSIQWVLRDISERIDLDTLRNDLIAMVYHDLRSPLANVTASLDILSSLTPTNRDETTVSLLNIAMRSSDRIQRLLNSLLDVYRLEAGQTVVNRKEVDPNTLISEVIDVIQPSLETKNQTLNRAIANDLPPLWVDPDMIRRVLVNLMENASKFSPQDSHIEVGASLVDGHSKIWVKDDGPGIPVDDQERIFDKFSRLKVNGAIKGLGLGLTFCKLAVIGHGGEIWVDSEPGKGSTFFFTLPPKG